MKKISQFFFMGISVLLVGALLFSSLIAYAQSYAKGSNDFNKSMSPQKSARCTNSWTKLMNATVHGSDTGAGSYSIDVPAGGLSSVAGAIFQGCQVSVVLGQADGVASYQCSSAEASANSFKCTYEGMEEGTEVDGARYVIHPTIGIKVIGAVVEGQAGTGSFLTTNGISETGAISPFTSRYLPESGETRTLSIFAKK